MSILKYTIRRENITPVLYQYDPIDPNSPIWSNFYSDAPFYIRYSWSTLLPWDTNTMKRAASMSWVLYRDLVSTNQIDTIIIPEEFNAGLPGAFAGSFSGGFASYDVYDDQAYDPTCLHPPGNYIFELPALNNGTNPAGHILILHLVKFYEIDKFRDRKSVV